MSEPNRDTHFIVVTFDQGKATEYRKVILFGFDEVCGLLAFG
jgi:hypothetical protein